MATEPIVFLYKEVESDLQSGLIQARNIGCNGLITSIVNPQFTRKFQNDTDPHGLGHTRFTRSDLLLDPNSWASKVVVKLTESIDCDSTVETVRKYGESVIRQEMAFAQHVSNVGCITLKVNGTDTQNLAAVVASSLKGTEISFIFVSLFELIILELFCRCDTYSGNSNGGSKVAKRLLSY